jgi:hypothetical protein
VFILARLEKAGLRPSPAAGRAALLRRVTFDLTGLPPTPRELADFLQDTRTDAYVRVVDRLLASPHYGERWAQHWLDVARYAESNGYEGDAERPHAYHYRDYVVRSLNADKPFDRFVTEQLAGDLLASGAPARERAELLVAAGFNRCGPVHQVGGNVDLIALRQETLTEMTGGVGSAFLGLTVACARCHDHKFDPVSTRDYYRLQAFFTAARPREIDLTAPADRQAHARRVEEWNARAAPIRQELTRLEAPYQQRLAAAKKARLEEPYRAALAADPKKRTPEQKKLAELAQMMIKVSWDELVDALSPADRQRRAELRQRLHELEARKPHPPPQAWTLEEGREARNAHVLKRGDPHKPGALVSPAFPPALGAEAPARPAKDGGLDRLDFARWLTRPDHPLTARVIVNRLWQHHFGQGLSRTPNDFGLRGEAPTHPELLDWLACELVAHGWSLKHLHRLMVLSSTYQQTSSVAGSRAGNPQLADPDNRLLWRMNRQRLDGEALRDSVLAVAGTLNRRLGGPVVRVPLEPEVYELIFTEGEPDGLWPANPDPREHARRSLYLFHKRNVRLPLFEAFDQPDTLTSCPVRAVSTFAPQALILLNGPFMQEQSRALAGRLLWEAGPGNAARVEWAYRLALARPPRPVELRTSLEFLDAQAELLRTGTSGVADPAAAALADFCLALLNRNEFLYVD